MKKGKTRDSFGYKLIRPILALFVHIVLKPEIEGINKLPEGGFILVGNHISKYDPLLVGYLTKRPVHFLTKKELLDNKLFGFIFKLMGMIRVDRQNHDDNSKEDALKYLNEDKIVCVFPEGTINTNKSAYILPFKYGAVSFAKKSGKPIVPFVIKGKPSAFKRKTKIVISDPYYVEDDLEKENDKLQDTIIKLLKKV